MARVAVRVDGDAGAEAGMGHVYRSLALARLLLEQVPDTEIKFFMRDFPEGIARARGEGVAVHTLPVQPSQADYEAAFGTYQPDILVIDTLGSSVDLISANAAC